MALLTVSPSSTLDHFQKDMHLLFRNVNIRQPLSFNNILSLI